MAFVGLGTFAMAQETPSSTTKMNEGDMKQNMEMRQQKQLDKMKADLNLNDDQVMKIKAMQQERQSKMAAYRDAKMQNAKDAKDKMKQILTPEQYAKWENNMKDKMGKFKHRKMMKKADAAMPMESN